jgi:hypothetical protein
MICAKLKPAVSGFAQEFPGKVAAENVDATTPEGAAAVKSLGFQSHGLAIRSPDGNVLWKQPDHTVRIEDVREELRRLTKA